MEVIIFKETEIQQSLVDTHTLLGFVFLGWNRLLPGQSIDSSRIWLYTIPLQLVPRFVLTDDRIHASASPR